MHITEPALQVALSFASLMVNSEGPILITKTSFSSQFSWLREILADSLRHLFEHLINLSINNTKHLAIIFKHHLGLISLQFHAEKKQ